MEILYKHEYIGAAKVQPRCTELDLHWRYNAHVGVSQSRADVPRFIVHTHHIWKVQECKLISCTVNTLAYLVPRPLPGDEAMCNQGVDIRERGIPFPGKSPARMRAHAQFNSMSGPFAINVRLRSLYDLWLCIADVQQIRR